MKLKPPQKSAILQLRVEQNISVITFISQLQRGGYDDEREDSRENDRYEASGRSES